MNSQVTRTRSRRKSKSRSAYVFRWFAYAAFQKFHKSFSKKWLNKPPEHQYILYHSLFIQLVHWPIQVNDRCCVFQDAAAKKSNFQIKSTNPLAKEIEVAANIVRIERRNNKCNTTHSPRLGGTQQRYDATASTLPRSVFLSLADCRYLGPSIITGASGK